MEDAAQSTSSERQGNPLSRDPGRCGGGLAFKYTILKFQPPAENCSYISDRYKVIANKIRAWDSSKESTLYCQNAWGMGENAEIQPLT